MIYLKFKKTLPESLVVSFCIALGRFCPSAFYALRDSETGHPIIVMSQSDYNCKGLSVWRELNDDIRFYEAVEGLSIKTQE